MISVGFSLVFVLFVSFRVFFAGLLGFRDFLECFLSTVYEYDLCMYLFFRCFFNWFSLFSLDFRGFLWDPVVLWCVFRMSYV